MEYKIKDILKEASPEVIQRGRQYYQDGAVEQVKETGPGEFMAKVWGSEDRPYLVEISFDEDGEADTWECDCPYDWGPVCKHTVAALLAIEAGEGKKEPDGTEEDVQGLKELIKQLDIETLRKLVLKQCGRDNTFRLEVLSRMECTDAEEELYAVKKIIKASVASIQRNIDYRDWDDVSCYDLCTDIKKILNKVHPHIEQGLYSRALDILLYLLVTCIELPGEIPDEDGYLDETAKKILDMIQQCTEGIAGSADASERQRQLERIAVTASDLMLDAEYGEYQYELLCAATPLADKQTVGRLYDLLEQWEQSASLWDLGYNKETHYYLISAVEGPEPAREYLNQNLDVDALWEIAVQEDIEQGNYANAERLCLEKKERNADRPHHFAEKYDYLLYTVYEKWGRQEEQLAQARQLVLSGDWSYYQILKDAMLADGRWEEEYPGLRDEVRSARPLHEYMNFLQKEGDVDLLMEQVRLHGNEVFQYGAVLASRYGGEIYALCMEQIRELAKPVTNRGEYQNLCGKIQKMGSFGGWREALELIEELAQAYPRRRAMMEELKKARENLEKAYR